ncbi:MAG: radical SAM protein [Candidatus Lokiarchaeota archaeon]|nr:radical SAM protein [Candidatus Lokiarchaeota archaeon]
MQSRKNVILIRPEMGKALKGNTNQVNPPIGLGYLAAYLDRAGYHVDILDLANRQISMDTLVAFIKRRAPILVGISALTAYYMRMKELCLALRAALDDIVLVLGGVHPSSLPDHAIRECDADFIVIGEGEQTLLELARAIESGTRDFSRIKGIAYRQDGSVKTTEPRDLIDDIDSLPMPAWHKINPNTYPKNPHGVLLKHVEVAPIVTSRGCPFTCMYCASCQFWRQRIRFRSVKSVVDEIQYLHDEFGIREIHFWDDNITLRRDHIIALCKELIKRGLNKMAFSAPNGVRVDTLDKTMLRWMKAAGFYSMTFAVESGSARILREMKKKIDLVKILENTVIAHELGFMINSFFIIGFPGDTEESITRTIQYAVSIPFTYSVFFHLKPLPGSDIFTSWSSKVNLQDFNWDRLTDYMHVSQEALCKLPVAYLVKMYKRAYTAKILRIKTFPVMAFWSLRFFHFAQLRLKISNMIAYYLKFLFV